MQIVAVSFFNHALTTSQDEWQPLKWWQKFLVHLGLKKRPVGQLEQVIQAMNQL